MPALQPRIQPTIDYSRQDIWIDWAPAIGCDRLARGKGQNHHNHPCQKPANERRTRARRQADRKPVTTWKRENPWTAAGYRMSRTASLPRRGNLPHSQGLRNPATIIFHLATSRCEETLRRIALNIAFSPTSETCIAGHRPCSGKQKAAHHGNQLNTNGLRIH